MSLWVHATPTSWSLYDPSARTLPLASALESGPLLQNSTNLIPMLLNLTERPNPCTRFTDSALFSFPSRQGSIHACVPNYIVFFLPVIWTGIQMSKGATAAGGSRPKGQRRNRPPKEASQRSNLVQSFEISLKKHNAEFASQTPTNILVPTQGFCSKIAVVGLSECRWSVSGIRTLRHTRSRGGKLQ